MPLTRAKPGLFRSPPGRVALGFYDVHVGAIVPHRQSRQKAPMISMAKNYR